MSTARFWPRSFTRNSTPGMSRECLVSIGTEYNLRPPAWPLTVKLRGRAEALDWSRGCRLSSRTRGHTTEHHGPRQRLLEGAESNRARVTVYRSAAKEKLVEPAGSKATESL